MKTFIIFLFVSFTFHVYGQTIPESELSNDGLILPRYTKADKATLPETQGRVVFNTTDQSMVYHNGTYWDRVASEDRVLQLIDERFQPYVSNSGDRLYLAPGQFIVVPGISAAQSTVSDIDGNTYQTVTIDGQEWMAENLKTTRYANGDPIPYGASVSGIGPADDYYFYYNDNVINKNLFGVLYTHAAASDPRNVCPTGWHTPFKAELEALKTFIASDGWSAKEGLAIKAQLAGWRDDPPFFVPVDHYGLAVIPTQSYNSINSLGENAYFWAHNLGLLSTNNGACVLMRWTNDSFNIDEQFRSQGFNIRCKKD